MSFTTFAAIDIGRTGAGFANHWIDSIAHNLANVNTTVPAGEEPFRALKPVVAPLSGGPYAASGSGVHLAQMRRAEGDAPVAYDPAHPHADEDGIVTQAVVDTGGEMVDLMIANRHYQASIRTIQSAREAYQAALRLGSGQ